MRIRYDEASDILILHLRDKPPTDAVEEPGGVVVSYGADGQPVSVEFLNATAHGLVKAGHLSITLDSGEIPEGAA